MRVFIYGGMRDRSMRSGTKLVREIQLTDWSTADNLSNRSSGVQIPRDICTRFGRYSYSTRCSWIIKYSTVGYSRVQYSTVQYSTVQYSTVQYSTVQYSTVQYSTVE